VGRKKLQEAIPGLQISA